MFDLCHCCYFCICSCPCTFFVFDFVTFDHPIVTGKNLAAREELSISVFVFVFSLFLVVFAFVIVSLNHPTAAGKKRSPCENSRRRAWHNWLLYFPTESLYFSLSLSLWEELGLLGTIDWSISTPILRWEASKGHSREGKFTQYFLFSIFPSLSILGDVGTLLSWRICLFVLIDVLCCIGIIKTSMSDCCDSMAWTETTLQCIEWLLNNM